MLFTSSIYHVGQYWLIYIWEHGYEHLIKYNWITMTVTLKGWNWSDSTAQLCCLLPSLKAPWWEAPHQGPWGSWAEGGSCDTCRVNLLWRNDCPQWHPLARHSPPWGLPTKCAKVVTCPKPHWCHQWPSISRPRGCLIYKRVCQTTWGSTYSYNWSSTHPAQVGNSPWRHLKPRGAQLLIGKSPTSMPVMPWVAVVCNQALALPIPPHRLGSVQNERGCEAALRFQKTALKLENLDVGDLG